MNQRAPIVIEAREFVAHGPPGLQSLLGSNTESMAVPATTTYKAGQIEATNHDTQCPQRSRTLRHTIARRELACVAYPPYRCNG